MRLSRLVVKNLRAIKEADVAIDEAATIIIGENNTGKSSLIHAIRLCLDVALPSSLRTLSRDDIHSSVDQQKPFQVLVGVEFSGFEGRENEEAFVHGAQIAKDRARMFYRFRPRRSIRDQLARNEPVGELAIADFGWELFGGGNPEIDLTNIEWNHENGDIGATPIAFQYLQSYLIAYMPALRDVEADLQQSRRSPLMRLIEVSGIEAKERQALVDAVRVANQEIEHSATIKALATSIDKALKQISGPAFSLDVELGLSDPTFQAIARNLLILLTSDTIKQFEPRQNGLGLNNILYIAVLIEHFRKRSAAGSSAGELILIEEPEAHLHPQLQATLVDALRSLPFQSIATSHSTQVTSRVPLGSLITLTRRAGTWPAASVPAKVPGLTMPDVYDLERYLDATKSRLLFARKVMLVEGAAELILIPPLVRQVLGIDLEREGISLSAIHGTHFAPFAKLFTDEGLPKRCAIVADADNDPGQQDPDDDVAPPKNLAPLAGKYVSVFLGATTFERELTLQGNASMLACVASDLGAPRVQAKLTQVANGQAQVTEALQTQVLRTANRFGKARFAQVAARHAMKAGELPAYISNAVAWLLQ